MWETRWADPIHGIGGWHIYSKSITDMMIPVKAKEREFCFRVHKAQGKCILAFCDSGLSGKTLKLGSLDFPVSAAFYGGECCGKAEILEKLRAADIVNAVGARAVALLVDKGFASRECVLMVGGVPHVQAIRT